MRKTHMVQRKTGCQCNGDLELAGIINIQRHHTHCLGSVNGIGKMVKVSTQIWDNTRSGPVASDYRRNCLLWNMVTQARPVRFRLSGIRTLIPERKQCIPRDQNLNSTNLGFVSTAPCPRKTVHHASLTQLPSTAHYSHLSTNPRSTREWIWVLAAFECILASFHCFLRRRRYNYHA